MREIEIKVILKSDGKIQVSGPITDKILCFGLLEQAKDVIRLYEPHKSDILQPKDFLQ